MLNRLPIRSYRNENNRCFHIDVSNHSLEEEGNVMTDRICPNCKHPRRSHSRRGCEEYIDIQTGKECPCKKKFTEI